MHVTNVPLLQQKIYGFLDFAAGLVRQFGSRDAAIAHVKDHFEHKFDLACEAPISFSGLPNNEPDFTEQSVPDCSQDEDGQDHRHVES